MKRIVLVALVALALPAMTMAQWTFEGNFPADSTVAVDGGGLGGHGIAVDPDGKVWWHAFAATDSVQVEELDNGFFPIREIYVWNADGTPADFSPLQFLDFPDGSRDTLGGTVITDENGDKAWDGRSGRGLRADAEGNILAAQFNTLYKIDYQTGEGIAKYTYQSSLRQPATDDAGNVYIGPVLPGLPIEILDSDLNFVETAVPASSNFSRSLEATADGLVIFATDYENPYTIVYQRADEFSPFDSVGVVFEGFQAESITFNPATGNVWVSSGNPLNSNLVDLDRFTLNTWYEFDTQAVLDYANGLAEEPPFLNLFTWETDGFEGRPRGLAFSPDGMTAYVTQFSQPFPHIQQFMAAEFTGVERDEAAGIPTTISLEANYPNPFNPTTTIEFGVDVAGPATLKVFDMLGREVATLLDEAISAGSYTATFEASSLPSGTYFYTLSANGQSVTKSMVLMK
ncbi:MAG: T9SS type A sorting domain-containing protein [Bacteroidota bacterium]